MRASDLIDFLQCAIDQHGDHEVCVVLEDAGNPCVKAHPITDLLHWRGEFLVWPYVPDSMHPFSPLQSLRRGNAEVTEGEMTATDQPKPRR